MKRLLGLSFFLLTLLLPLGMNKVGFATAQAESAPLTQPNSIATVADVEEVLQSAPVMFIQNVGQFDEDARFKVHGGNYEMWLANDALWITLLEAGDENARIDQPRQGVNLKLSFVNANPQPKIESFNLLETKMNYFLGNDPDKWRSEVPVWGGVRYKEIYPGIDLELTGENGQIVQRFVTTEDAELETVRLRVEGADGMELLTKRSNGEVIGLRVDTAIGDVSLPLFTIKNPDGTSLRSSLTPTLNINEIGTPFGLDSGQDLDKLGASLPPSRDSKLIYSTFLGSSNYDWGKALALTAAGEVVLTGSTNSSDFPTSVGVYDTSHNGGFADVFVAKLSANGSDLLMSTFIGGNGNESGSSLTLTAAGETLVTGYTLSSDFPTSEGAYDTSYSNESDVFLLKLSPNGETLFYSTFLGGSDFEQSYSLVLTEAGEAVVTGYTRSLDFPTTALAYDTTFGGGSCFFGPCSDVFVAKFSADGGTLLYSTFLGGSDDDQGNSLALTEAGEAVLTGETESQDFPSTEEAYNTSLNGIHDAFVTKLSADGSTLLYSTFLGGSGLDFGYSLALTAGGEAVVTGRTQFSNFPTSEGAYDTSHNGSYDTFVVKLSEAGDALLYSTLLGGSQHDQGTLLVLTEAGEAIITGFTRSLEFPTSVFAYNTSHHGESDIFIAKLSSNGDRLLYSTFLGGSEWEAGYSLALTAAGEAVITGETKSFDFPTNSDGYDTTFDPGKCTGICTDAFVTKLAIRNDPTHTLYLPSVRR